MNGRRTVAPKVFVRLFIASLGFAALIDFANGSRQP
jgi:hypothetical protein